MIMKSFLLFLITAGVSAHVFCQTNDSTAIVRLIEKESATWLRRFYSSCGVLADRTLQYSHCNERRW